MDTLTHLFLSNIKVYDTPKEYEVFLTRSGIPERWREQKDAPHVRIGKGTIVPFCKPTWISHLDHQSLVFNDFRFIVTRER